MTDTLLVVFAGILAFAVLMQSAMFLLAFLHFRRLSNDLFPQVQRLTDKTEAALATITDIAENIKPITGKLADSAEIIHGRVVEVDDFLGGIMGKSRREFSGIEDSLIEASQRIQETINILSGNILTPVSRINALTKAVRVAVGVFFRRREEEKSIAGTSSAGSNNDTIFF